VNPEAARDVVSGRDDAAAVRIPSDDQRLRSQGRILELLDRGEKRVEVEVGQDHAHRLRRRRDGPISCEAAEHRA
jgi:hypothetical protein